MNPSKPLEAPGELPDSPLSISTFSAPSSQSQSPSHSHFDRHSHSDSPSSRSSSPSSPLSASWAAVPSGLAMSQILVQEGKIIEAQQSVTAPSASASDEKRQESLDSLAEAATPVESSSPSVSDLQDVPQPPIEEHREPEDSLSNPSCHPDSGDSDPSWSFFSRFPSSVSSPVMGMATAIGFLIGVAVGAGLMKRRLHRLASEAAAAALENAASSSAASASLLMQNSSQASLLENLLEEKHRELNRVIELFNSYIKAPIVIRFRM